MFEDRHWSYHHRPLLEIRFSYSILIASMFAIIHSTDSIYRLFGRSFVRLLLRPQRNGRKQIRNIANTQGIECLCI